MGRKKVISDEELIVSLERFLLEKCQGKAQFFKIPRFGAYLRNNGYPEVKDHIIRRRKQISAYLEEAKKLENNYDLYIIATFRTIDVEHFIDKNHSISAMRRALSELNSYYKSVCESAIRLNEKSQKNINDKNENESIIIELRRNLQELNENNKQQKDRIKELKEQNSKQRKIIDDYVYPEIANELLKREGLLINTGETVDYEKLKSEIITASTAVKSKSNVIKGLFEKLEE